MSKLSRFALFVLVACLAALVLQAVGQNHSPGSNNGTPTTTSSLNIVFVSGSAPGLMASQTIDVLRSRSGGSLTSVSDLADLSGISGQVGATSIVVFDSAWLSGKVQDLVLRDFLATILPKEVKIVAIGGSTSLLFDALLQVKTDLFAPGRNPASANPSLAGYKLKAATSASGTAYYGDSILIGDPANPGSAADSVLAWG